MDRFNRRSIVCQCLPNDYGTFRRIITEYEDEWTADDIVWIMGEAVFYGHIPAIAVLNGIIRDYKISITSSSVFKAIYNAKCRQMSENARKEKCLITFTPYDEETEIEYRSQYSHFLKGITIDNV